MMLHETNYAKTKYLPSKKRSGKRCECGMLLFGNAQEAARAGTPFYAHINLDVDGRCPCCAGFHQVDYLVQKEIETMTSKNESNEFHFGNVEKGVELPDNFYSRRGGKYDKVVKVIFGVPVGQWNRLEVANKKAAVRLRSHCQKVASKKELKITGRILEEEKGTWLYWKLYEPEEED